MKPNKSKKSKKSYKLHKKPKSKSNKKSYKKSYKKKKISKKVYTRLLSKKRLTRYETQTLEKALFQRYCACLRKVKQTNPGSEYPLCMNSIYKQRNLDPPKNASRKC